MLGIKWACPYYTCARRCFSTVPIKDAIECKEYLEDGHAVAVKGWVRAVTSMKKYLFLKVNDGSTSDSLQVVTTVDNYGDKELCCGMSVEIMGQIVPSTHPGQPVEMIPTSIDVLGHCDASDYPLHSKKQPLSYIRKYLHLRPRTKEFSALLRVRNTASQAVHRYFQDNGFLHVHTPVITSCDCEGAGNIFEVTPLAGQTKDDKSPRYFFGTPSYLAVSGQLQLESIACAMSKAYSFGPVFRAESDLKGRHLSEFHMAEGEMVTSADGDRALQQVMEVTEELCKHVLDLVLSQNPDDVALYHNNIAQPETKSQVNICLEKPFNRITYNETIGILKEASKKVKFQYEPNEGVDLAREHEEYLVQFYNHQPVFVTDFPTSLKAFYAKQHKNATHKTHSMDLVLPMIGEVAGGTVREENLGILQQNLTGITTRDNYEWYLDLRRYGTVPHGGFGLGFDRLIQFVLGIPHIRDATPFPRYDGTISL